MIIDHPTRPGSERRALRPPLGRSDALVRAAVAALVGETRQHGGADTVFRALWPDDRAAPVLLRAATSPAQMSSSEWAGVLASTAVADFIGGLGPVSAAAQLIAAGLRVELGRASGVRLPSVINTASTAAFIAEGAPRSMTWR